VRLLSGFSPSLLKLVLAGEPLATEEDDEEGAATAEQGLVDDKAKAKCADKALEVLRRALDDETYGPIRVILSASTEGALAGYTFEPGAQRPCVDMRENEDAMECDWEEIRAP